MTIEFRELRKTEVVEAVAFANEHGCRIMDTDIVWTKSVIVWKGGSMYACALVTASQLNQDHIHIGSIPEAEGSHTVLALLDSVVRKLHHSGTRKIKLRFANDINRAASVTQTHWVSSFASTLWQNAQAHATETDDHTQIGDTAALVDALDPGPKAA